MPSWEDQHCPIPEPLVPIGHYEAGNRRLEGEGIAPILGLGLSAPPFGRVYHNALRLIMAAEGPHKSFGAWWDLARLRQPHVQI